MTGGLNDGIVLLEVDDIFEAGTDRHRKLMVGFYLRYKCGKYKKLLDLGSEGTLISGVRVKQNKDYSFDWDMIEYASKMHAISTERGYLSSVAEIDDKKMGEVISVNGKIGWLGGNGRPDLAAGHSIIAGGYKHKSPQLISDCNLCETG